MLIIGLGQIIQFHQDVDKANVSLLLQQLGGDGAERSPKELPREVRLCWQRERGVLTGATIAGEL
jgi:hypothetical protein